MAKLLPSRPRIAVGMGTCGAGNGAEGVFHAFADAIDKRAATSTWPPWAASVSARRSRW